MRSLAILVVFFSFNSYANCPDLSGRYNHCKLLPVDEGRLDYQEVSQEVNWGVTKYTFLNVYKSGRETIREYLADGITHVTRFSDGNMRQTSVCKDNQLIYKLGNDLTIRFYKLGNK